MADGFSSPTAAPPAVAPTAPTVPVDLRPLTTSELIDRGFALYRAHFAGFLLLALLCQSAPLLGQILVTALKLNPTQNELLENPAAFYVILPDAAGNCQAGTLPVYRFFDNRADANHRHTVDLSVRRQMINRDWVPEGSGPNAVAFCSPV